MERKMHPTIAVCTLAVGILASSAIAQQATPAAPPPAGTGRQPPPQAYTDCLGKQAGATVQHTTPEGKVAATCVDSPKGLVARPNQPKGSDPSTQPPPR